MKRMINLLPPALRKQQILRRRLMQWSVVTCLVLLVGWLFHWSELRGQKAQAQRLEMLAREHQPTRSLMRELVEMRQKLVDLEQQERIASELEHQRNALVLLGVVSQAAQRTDGRLRVTKLQLTDFQKIDSGGRSASQVSTRGALTLSGVSLDNAAVAEMLDALQDAEIFSQVELVALKERETNEVSVRDYELRCEF